MQHQHPADGARPRQGLLLQDGADRLHGLVEGGILVEELLRLLAPALTVEPHEVHHGVDLVEQAVRGIEDVAERAGLAAGPALADLLRQELAVAQDGGQRRAELVAQVARHGRGVPAFHQAQRRGGVEQRRDHAVEPARRGAELVDVVSRFAVGPVLGQQRHEPRDGLDGRLELSLREDGQEPRQRLVGPARVVGGARARIGQTHTSTGLPDAPGAGLCIPRRL